MEHLKKNITTDISFALKIHEESPVVKLCNNLLIVGVIILGLSSCRSDEEQILKSVLKNLSLGEVNAVNSYITVETTNNLNIYSERFCKRTVDMIPKFAWNKISCKLVSVSSAYSYIVASVPIWNTDSCFISSIPPSGRLTDVNILVDTFRFQSENNQKLLKFEYGPDSFLRGLGKLQYATVKVKALNVRAGPGTNFEALTLLNEGDIILAGNFQKNAEFRYCLHFNYKNGTYIKGYVFASYITDKNSR